MKRSRQIAFDCALAFLLTAALILPLFRVVYFDNWMSIEGSFIADARYILAHWPHPRWHALWYCGTRFDYIYPPLTRYGAAIAATLVRVDPAQGYHIYCAILYCLGVAGVYFLARVATRSRGAAWLAAAAEALLSPAFLLLPPYREDSMLRMPERLNVLIKWGEGPHMNALALIPWALGFSFLALEKRRPAALGAAALAAALAVSNNFYGAVALATFFPLLVCGVWMARRETAVWLRAAAIAALAYGLCAWWLAPSYFTLTARNLMLVAQPGNNWSKCVALAVLAAYLAAAWRFGRNSPERAYRIFLWGSVLLFGLQVLGNFWLNFRISGEPLRFVPELDLVLILAALEGIRGLWKTQRVPAVLLTLACFSCAANYLSHPWSVFHPDRDYRQRVEYRLTEWIARNLPGSRVFATGSVRFWYTTWRDLEQVSGASDQGMESLNPALAQWQLLMGWDPDRDVDWMIALGSDAIIAHQTGSQEFWHAMKQPRKFMGKLPAIYDRDGDVIYIVPRRFPGLARAVDERRMETLRPIPWSNENAAELHAYAQAVEASDSHVFAAWQGTSAMRLRGVTKPGESVLVQETWDAGWHAYAGGKPLGIRKDVLGFLMIQAPPGQQDIRLIYELPPECVAGRVLTLASIAVLTVLLLWAGRRRSRSPLTPV